MRLRPRTSTLLLCTFSVVQIKSHRGFQSQNRKVLQSYMAKDRDTGRGRELEPVMQLLWITCIKKVLRLEIYNLIDLHNLNTFLQPAPKSRNCLLAYQKLPSGLLTSPPRITTTLTSDIIVSYASFWTLHNIIIQYLLFVCVLMVLEIYFNQYGEACRHGNDHHEGSLYSQIPRNRRHSKPHKTTQGRIRISQ